jgi:hypothetical protein
MPQARTKSAPRYKPHPMFGAESKVRQKVEAETGKSWERWLAAARKHGGSAKDLERWLRDDHGFGSMSAQWLAHEATTDDFADYADPEPLVDALYSGERAALRPVHEAVVDAMLALGEDVTVTACKTMVPVYRKHVFAEIRPVEDAVEVQLALGDVPAKGRLGRASSRMPGERMTHRVVVGSAKEVDRELRGWLASAYEHGAGKMTRSTEFEVPADFAKAVRASKKADATWASMTPAMQRDMVQWVTSAKQEDTRARRMATALEKLGSGKKRVY